MKNDQIIDRLEKFWTRCYGTMRKLHQAYEDDIEFFLRDNQWDAAVKRERDQAKPKRLTLTVNRLRQFIYQVVNDYKKSEMSAKILPHDSSQEDQMTAEVRRGHIRAIERKKGGVRAYHQAAKLLVSGGMGGWRIDTEYCDPKSFDQDIKFRPIQDMTTVTFDIESCEEPDYCDMRDLVIQEKYSKERFKEEFGQDPEDFMGPSEMKPTVWGTHDGPCVSEYWFKEEVKRTLVKLIDGQDVYKEELKEYNEDGSLNLEAIIARDKDGEPIERRTHQVRIWRVKVAGKRVIEKQLWPGKYIPVVIVTGRKTVNKGEITIEGLARTAKDAQRSYNFAKSAKAERMALVAKAPYKVPLGGIPPAQRSKWETSNTHNHPYLEFAVYDEKGRPIPPPTERAPVQLDPAFAEEEAQSSDEMKASIGMYDASVGNRSNETSGRAILARDQQQDTTNYDFTESMVVGIQYSTKICVDLIPKVYDTERMISIVGTDDKEKVIWINNKDRMAPESDPNYDREADYDIDIEVGPGSATKQQETREDLQVLFQAVPETAFILGPHYIKNTSMRNADQAAEEFKQYISLKTGMQFQGQVDPRMVQGMQQQMQQMQQEMQRLQKVEQEHQAMQADKSIDSFRAETERMKVMIEAQDRGIELQVAGIEAQRDVAVAQIQARAPKPTGGQPGNKPTGGVKPGSSMER